MDAGIKSFFNGQKSALAFEHQRVDGLNAPN
jgi:hypothetical protein